MSFLDITLGEILYYAGLLVIILGAVYAVLWLISEIIDWVWWKKENRQLLADFRYFLNHKEELLEKIKEEHERN